MIRQMIFFGILMLTIIMSRAVAAPATGDQLPASYVPSGKTMFQLYCATCHGTDARGDGPMASVLKTPPANLATLTKRHGGKFPTAYVTEVLRGGTSSHAHGSSDMPTWGPIFQYFDKNSEQAVRKRIDNLCNYLASIQE